MLWRIIGTVIAVLVYGWAMTAYTPQATLITGQVAGRQFENSDGAYLQAVYTMNFFSTINVVMSLVVLAILVAIWLKPARLWIKKGKEMMAVMIVIGGGALLLNPNDAHAFFEKTDRTEIIPILPNQSAFTIPGFGANQDSQAQLDSEAYLNKNKVSAKFFQIPHAKLTGSAGYSFMSGWDYYINTATLILVDRTRFSREWVDAHDRGTSPKKEGFPCQAKGDDKNPTGLNITVGISVGAYVTEANAAKFLYNFGVKTPQNINYTSGNIEADGKAIFQSIYSGRSLTEVMDDVGRKKIGTMVCAEIAKKTFDAANNSMMEIMDTVQKEAVAYFNSVGITLDFIGYADTWTFDHEIQSALNRRYAAIQDEQIAKALQPYTETIKALAAAQAVRAFGDKTDGKLPTTYMGVPPEVVGPLLGLPNVPRAATAPTNAPAR